MACVGWVERKRNPSKVGQSERPLMGFAALNPSYAILTDRLLDRGAGELDGLLPFGGFGRHHLAEVGWCAAHRNAAEVGEPHLHLRIRKRVIDGFVDLSDDIGGRA